MKRQIPLGALAALCGALGLMGFYRQAPPDLSTPKITIQTFVDAINRHDIKTMLLCVQNAKDTEDVETLYSHVNRERQYRLTNLIAETNTNTAQVAAEVQLRQNAGNQETTVSTVEIFALVKQGDDWHILPNPQLLQNLQDLAQNAPAGRVEMRPIGTMAALMTATKATAQVIGASACLSNIKQVDLAMIMYAQDYDDRLPRKHASYVDLVFPYIKSRSAFTCPRDVAGTISYTFNANMQEVPMEAIGAPAKTVLLYEGKNMQLDYRHDGKAVVGFADGHCNLIGPDQAKSLIWKVNYTPPAPKKSRRSGRSSHHGS